jgi:hypothetical protein
VFDAVSFSIFLKSSPKLFFNLFRAFFIPGGAKVSLPVTHTTGTICFSNTLLPNGQVLLWWPALSKHFEGDECSGFATRAFE